MRKYAHIQTIYRHSAYSCETELYGTCKCKVKLLEMIGVDLAFTSISFYCDANGKYSQLATCRSTCSRAYDNVRTPVKIRSKSGQIA